MANPACFVCPQNPVFSPAGLGPGGNADGSQGGGADMKDGGSSSSGQGGPGEDQSSAASAPFPARPHRVA